MGETFGLHLMVDGYGCDPSKLGDEDFVRRFLDEFPEEIGMTKLMSPYVVSYAGKGYEARGLSGFVLIAESHVSNHTFPSDGYVSIDVFSCKGFDTDRAIEDFREGFHLTRVRTCLIDREWPKAEAAIVNPQSFAYHERS